MRLQQDDLMTHLWDLDGKKRMKGWWKDILFDVYRAADQYQKTIGVAGNLAEIGVFQGRSLIPLINFASDEEYVVAVDPEVSSEHERYVRRAHASFNNLILDRCKSQSSEILKQRAPYRLFYVDGDHSKQGCLTDLNLAKDLVVEGGLVFVDDYNNKRYGKAIRDAVKRFIQKNDDWAMICTTDQTLWLTQKHFAMSYMLWFREHLTEFTEQESSWFSTIPEFNHKVGLHYWRDTNLGNNNE